MDERFLFDADAGAGSGGDAGGADGAGDAGQGAGAEPVPFGTDFKSPDTKTWVTTKGFKDAEAVAESARNLESLLGGDQTTLLKLPKDMTPEAMGPVWDKLGRPQDPKDYDIPMPETAGDPAFADSARAAFHKIGVTAGQAKALTEWWNEYATDQAGSKTKASDEKTAAEIATLKTEWGPNYQANEALVNRAADTFGMSEEQLMALKTTLGPAEAMKFMFKIGSKIGVETQQHFGEGAAGFQGMAPETAREQLAALQKDRGFAEQFNSKDPSVRKEAREKAARLNKIAYPGTTTIG